jgi:hypothetical protein
MAWQQSKAFHCRPSELLHIEDELTAYYFDRAIFTFGKAVEAELERVSQQGKGKSKRTQAQINMARQQVLNRWVGGPRQFRDPAAG